MICFPNCKINLGLNIIRKRDDQFHDIETVFVPLKLCDALEILPSKQTNFYTHGIEIMGLQNLNDNLVLKAYHILKNDYKKISPIIIHLYKKIPMGAGLGGGSADAAFMIELLNNYFELNLSMEEKIAYALQLGSDCPLFIINKTCFAQSRGEILEEINLNLSECKILLVKPNIHINTGWAFSQIKPSQPYNSCKNIVTEQPLSTWKNSLQNDFELPIFKQYPQLESIKNKLYNLGASYASMSGSGSVIFGIFESKIANNIKASTSQLFQSEEIFWTESFG